YVVPQPLPPFPTRRSSDLGSSSQVLSRGSDRMRTLDSARSVAAVAVDKLLEWLALEEARDVLGEQCADHAVTVGMQAADVRQNGDRKSTRLNTSHVKTSYA